jgi:hypothetical protein
VNWLPDVVGERCGELTLKACSPVEDRRDGLQRPVGDGVAVGPVLPDVEGSDAHPMFADRGAHGLEPVERVAGPELLVSVALGDDGVVVAFDGGPGSFTRGGEVVLDAFESALRQIEVVSGGASLAAGRGVEAALRAGMVASGLGGACFSGS